MTLTQMTLFFFGVMAVIVIAMLVHSYLDKRKIRKSLYRLTRQYKGTVVQESVFQYPRFYSEKNGRRFDLFFNVVKVGRHYILYTIYSLTASLPSPFLLIKKDSYKAISDESRFTEENGAILHEIDIPFQGRSKQPEWVQKAYKKNGIKELIQALDPFFSVQLGPDALVAGKPYEGLSDIDSEWVVRAVRTLEQLAIGLEECTR